MNKLRTLMTVLAASVLGGFWVTQAQATTPVMIETVTVGNPGNLGDPIEFQGVFGTVDYVYAIGKYEVTAGQYAAFLAAVGAIDPYALYDTRMWTHAEGCKIERTGSPGSYAYSVAPDWANRPVNFVSWGDAARFANWLHNGQPTGAPDLTTTEDGSYFLNGKQGDFELETVVREPDATWVIPTENEWYKAAYHKNDGVTGNYWNYPTEHNSAISNDLIEPDPGHNATFRGSAGDLTIGSPYYRTEVGAHENSASAYGTFDQGGNVQEFNETVPESDIRGIRGGSWFWGDILYKWYRPVDMHSSDQFSDLGFRVATATTLTGVSSTVPPANAFEILSSFPNPFNPSVTIRVRLETKGPISANIYDVSGRRVRRLIRDKVEEAGVVEVRWDGRSDAGIGMATGLYFLRVTSAGEARSSKLVLIK